MRIVSPVPDLRPGTRLRRPSWLPGEYIEWNGKQFVTSTGISCASVKLVDDYEIVSTTPTPLTLAEVLHVHEVRWRGARFRRRSEPDQTYRVRWHNDPEAQATMLMMRDDSCGPCKLCTVHITTEMVLADDWEIIT